MDFTQEFAFRRCQLDQERESIRNDELAVHAVFKRKSLKERGRLALKLVAFLENLDRREMWLKDEEDVLRYEQALFRLGGNLIALRKEWGVEMPAEPILPRLWNFLRDRSRPLFPSSMPSAGYFLRISS